jgi:hypothetical protein
MSHRDTPPHLAVILDIVNQKTGVMQVGDDGLDVPGAVLGDTQPHLEAVDQHSSHVLARHLTDVSEGLKDTMIPLEDRGS